MNRWEKFCSWLFGNTEAASAAASSSLPGTGALLDNRAPDEKVLDIHFAELVASSTAVNWINKAVSEWHRFPVFNQASTSACVAFTMAKLLGVMRWLKDETFVVFSPGDIYRRRINAPGEGMVGADAYAIAAEGVTLDAVLPSQNITETAINALKIPEYSEEIAALFKLSNPKPILPPVGDIDAVASIMQVTGKAVMVWFYFTAREWGLSNTGAYPDKSGLDYNVPKVLDNLHGLSDPASLHHSVAAVDFTLFNGKKALIIEDSAHFGGYNRRVITEDFFRARNFFVAYPMNLQMVKTQDVTEATKLRYVFTKSLYFIPWDDAKNQPSDLVRHNAQVGDVKALQQILQQMGYFPTNITATGYYGALTAQAVYKWQSDHKVASQPALTQLAGKIFGDASRVELAKELS